MYYKIILSNPAPTYKGARHEHWYEVEKGEIRRHCCILFVPGNTHCMASLQSLGTVFRPPLSAKPVSVLPKYVELKLAAIAEE